MSAIGPRSLDAAEASNAQSNIAPEENSDYLDSFVYHRLRYGIFHFDPYYNTEVHSRINNTLCAAADYNATFLRSHGIQFRDSDPP
jgi:hypothetical protein